MYSTKSDFIMSHIDSLYRHYNLDNYKNIIAKMGTSKGYFSGGDKIDDNTKNLIYGWYKIILINLLTPDHDIYKDNMTDINDKKKLLSIMYPMFLDKN